MAGYSDTPLAKKLGIKSGHRLVLLREPDNSDATLDDLPEDVTVLRQLRSRRDVIVIFSKRRVILEKQFESLARSLDHAGGLWIAWPKKASGVPTDLSEVAIRAVALANGLVDNKVCAIDDTWSGLRLVYRLKD